MLKRINEGLPGLIVGIVLYGIVVQLTGVWFIEDPWAYSFGLWYGIVIAIGMAIHMAVVIYDSITFYEGKRTSYRIVAKSTFRYFIVVVLFYILVHFHLGNLIMAFLGVMGLKVSAYMQPLFNMALRKFRRTDATLEDENSENLNEEVTL